MTQEYKQRNLKGKKLEDYKKSLKLTSVQHEVIIGTLLGDASMSLRKGKPCYNIKFEQGEMHAEYIDHLYKIFEPFTGSPPSWRWIDKKQTRQALWFRTYRHESFIYYWNLFYDDSSGQHHKIVPKNIAKYITPRVLAYWFMDDGSICSSHKNFYINSQGFEKHESELLCSVLKEKFNITASIHKDKNSWRIYIKSESSKAFKELVEPYVISCFEYRLSLD